MALLVADTSALASLGTVAGSEPSPLDNVIGAHRVCIPEQVVSELRETASYEDRSGRATQAVLDRRTEFDVQTAKLEADFPLDEGENAAVSLANDLDAAQFLCDEFNQLAFVHASLADTRLVTTPTLLTAFVRNGKLTTGDAADSLSEMIDARSWDTNTYVERATTTLRRQME